MKKVLSLVLSVALLSSHAYADVFIVDSDSQKPNGEIATIGNKVFELPEYPWNDVGSNDDLADNSNVKTITDDSTDDYETVIIDRTTVLSLSELAERINNADSVDEIQALLLANGHLLGDVSQYEYFKNGNDELKNMTVHIISDRRLVSEKTLTKLLDETIALVRIGYSSPSKAMNALEECADILGINMCNYINLNETWKYRVADMVSKKRIFDTNRFRDCFYEAVAYAKNFQDTKCGGSGHCSAERYDLHVVNTDKSAITEAPSDGTPVSINVITYYNKEPDICYLAAIYDGNGKMKNAHIFNVSAKEQYEPVIFSADAEYDSHGCIKLFALENMKTVKPIYSSEIYPFESCIGDTVPQKEEETDGIIAIRGDITEKNSDSIIIEYCKERHFGYWIEFDAKKQITVSYSGTDMDDDLTDTVFYIKTDGSSYELAGVSAD